MPPAPNDYSFYGPDTSNTLDPWALPAPPALPSTRRPLLPSLRAGPGTRRTNGGTRATHDLSNPSISLFTSSDKIDDYQLSDFLPPVGQPVWKTGQTSQTGQSAQVTLPPLASEPAVRHTKQPEQLRLPQHTTSSVNGLIRPISKSHLGARASGDESGTELRKHACLYTGCGQRFSQNSHLVAHVRLHTGERPFACHYDGCNKAFTQRGNLRTHMRSHTGERPFECATCGRSFGQRGALRNHEVLHAQRHPYECRVGSCSRSFAQLGNLKAHHKSAHEHALRRFQYHLDLEQSLGGPVRYAQTLTGEDRRIYDHFCAVYRNGRKNVKGRGKGNKAIRRTVAEPLIPELAPNVLDQVANEPRSTLAPLHLSGHGQDHSLNLYGGYGTSEAALPPVTLLDSAFEAASVTPKSASTTSLSSLQLLPNLAATMQSPVGPPWPERFWPNTAARFARQAPAPQEPTAISSTSNGHMDTVPAFTDSPGFWPALEVPAPP